jgi:hypothetical protein
MAATPPPRTLADQLRGWSDERLLRLLERRPDLATPAPQDTAQLASRAAVRASLLRALEQLDRCDLTVLEALVVLGPLPVTRLRAVVNAEPSSVDDSLERLTDLALVWGTPEELRALSAVAEGVAPGTPGTNGLHPAAHPAPDGVEPGPPPDQRLAAVGDAARALLEHLDAHGGEGTTSAGGGPATPVQELLRHGLLARRAGGTLVLPGDVAVALRGGRTTRDAVDRPPPLATSGRDPALVDRAAAGAAFEACRRTELLLETWGTGAPAVLRTGGLGVRDLKAAATLLQVEEREAALLVELAHEAGLLAEAFDSAERRVWAPTDAVDTWAALPVDQQWLRLAGAWLRSNRLVGLVGTRDRSGRTWNALVPELTGPYAAETRRAALTEVAGLPPGEVLATGTGLPSLVARLEWRRPRRPTTRAEMTAWTLAEASLLGVVGLGGLAAAGRALLEGDPAAAGEALAPLLPDPVDHVLLQADLTAVAPGPLESGVARRLHDVADVESRGGASVHRFTRTSLRRALDAGWSAAELHAFLADVSRTPVPQALTFLVDDVARTHGSIRVGHAEAFLRADDEAALAALLHDPRAAGLGLRGIAPTVLVSSTPIDLLLPRLRELGAAPVVEAPDGTVHVARPDRVRARTPRERHSTHAEEARQAARLRSVVTAVRAGDRAVASRPAAPGSHLTPADTLARLREAVQAGTSVLIGYVDNHGSATERVVDPRAVDGGRLTAWDHRSEDTRTFAVHRITGVRPVSGS